MWQWTTPAAGKEDFKEGVDKAAAPAERTESFEVYLDTPEPHTDSLIIQRPLHVPQNAHKRTNPRHLNILKVFFSLA